MISYGKVITHALHQLMDKVTRCLGIITCNRALIDWLASSILQTSNFTADDCFHRISRDRTVYVTLYIVLLHRTAATTTDLQVGVRIDKCKC